MDNLFLFKADVFPFPGAWGIEYLAVLYWRAILLVTVCLFIVVGVERLTEGVRTRLHGSVARWMPGVLFLGSVMTTVVAGFFVYKKIPNAEFIIQYNRILSVSEVVLLSIILLTIACQVDRLVKRRCQTRCTVIRVLIGLTALTGIVLLVGTLAWQRVVYRAVGLAFLEFAVSLLLVSVVLVLYFRKTWRWQGWKSLVPQAAWAACALLTVLGWLSWCGLAYLLMNACA